MSKYWSSIVKQLDPYVPGEQPKVDNLIKLNTNECPYGPSPAAIEALKTQAAESLRLYPDPNSDYLKEAVAEYYSADISQVFVGNGSDEVLAHTFMAFFKKRAPLLFADITYSFYPVYCGLYKVDFEEIPLRENFELRVEDYNRLNGGILIANPNAPTGRYLELDKIEYLLCNNRDSVVVIDEAYIDFGGKSAVELLGKYDNLLVIQTLSKSRALAGLRVGFALGDTVLIEALERVKNSFNSYPLSRLAIFGAAASIRDTSHFEAMRAKIIATRNRLTTGLTERKFEVIPSLANFVFARNKTLAAAELSRLLRQKNILVRHFNKPKINNYLRITVGTEDECAKLLIALDEILEKEVLKNN